MSGNRTIQVPAETRERQHRAADPAVSAWVSANAGAGKTYVLAERVVRLLLAGTDPGRILCLTFTKAAAAEMANRVFKILGEWTRLDDDALDTAIESVTGERLPAARRVFARQLFARALETPGGLKIQTIHAFCDRILHDFPFEANVPGHFDVLDENQARELLDEARATVLQRAAALPDSALGRALFTVIDAAADVSVDKAIAAIVHDRHILAGWVGASGSPEAAANELETLFGIDDGHDNDDLHREMLEAPDFPLDYRRSLVAAARASGASSNIDFADRATIAETGTTLAARRDAWLEAFFTEGGNGTPRARVVTKAVLEEFPDLAERAEREVVRLDALRATERALRAVAATQALIVLAYGIVGEYEAAKRRVGMLDYGDLIARTVALFEMREAAAWVQYKLDRGIDHILVDEAQDTSPAQWGIVAALAEEFFSGEGARAVRRTVFAVGDEKQSIYSFQG
ncbi:MAG: UvrD-helicase domain-containing protein, partial [Hyphomicrobiales bacterium]|nr:UvrD-helicase domain-containing protein [Hyphomicrobiales bacterium]